MNYLEILKARHEAQRSGVKILRTDTTIQFSPDSFLIQDTQGNTFRYKPDKTLRIKGKYRLLSLVGVIRAYIFRYLRSVSNQRSRKS